MIAAAAPSSSFEVEDHRRMNIVQGEYHVTRDPEVVLTTLLGSCVAACMQDPVAGIGGMNHFLLPDSDGNGEAGHLRYGVHSMELLINGLLGLGARRERLQVWLFGGARLFDRFADIGSKNSNFAEDFIRREELIHMGGSLRGTQARRVQFWPVSGRVRQLAIAKADASSLARPPARPAPPPPSGSDVELF